MSKKKNPIARDLRTPKYHKRIVESKKRRPKREFMELERQIDAEWEKDNKKLKWE